MIYANSTFPAFDWFNEGRSDYLLGKPFSAPRSAVRVCDRDAWEKGYVQGRAECPDPKSLQRGGVAVSVPVVSDRELLAKERLEHPLFNYEKKACYDPAKNYLG